MKMTDERKRLMAKLRKKFGWRSIGKPNSKTILYRFDPGGGLIFYLNDGFIADDLDVAISLLYPSEEKGIQGSVVKTIFLSPDELKLICAIYDEKKKEIEADLKGETIHD